MKEARPVHSHDARWPVPATCEGGDDHPHDAITKADGAGSDTCAGPYFASFHEWLDELLETLGLSNASIVAASGIDPALVSRFRRGLRRPAADHIQLCKLLEGILKALDDPSTQVQLTELLAHFDNRIPVLDQPPPDPPVSRISQGTTSGPEPEADPGPASASSSALASPLFKKLYHQATALLQVTDKKPEKRAAPAKPLLCLPDRLDQLMDLFDTSNSHLARELNVDNSLVSRWRRGIRPLRADNPVLDEIVTYFAGLALQRAGSTDQPTMETGSAGPPSATRADAVLTATAETAVTDALVSEPAATLAAVAADQLQAHLGLAAPPATSSNLADPSATSTATDLSLLLKHWLLGQTPARPAPSPNAKQLLSMMDSWEDHPLFPDDLPTTLLRMPPPTRQGTYQGISGLREAVIRFLTDVALSPSLRHLKLFSNQMLDWLVADKDFLNTWSCLMYLILDRGHQVEVIHNLGRSDDEIGSAVDQWLPLYLNGSISSYTCRGLNQRGGPVMPLVSTLFVDAGNAAIRGEFVKGMEDEAIYRYYMGEKNVHAMERQFDQLKTISEPLLKGSRDGQEIFDHVISLLTRHREQAPKRPPVLTDAFVTPPLYLLPPALLEDILDQQGVSKEDRASLLDLHASLRVAVESYLKQGRLQLVYPGSLFPGLFCDPKQAPCTSGPPATDTENGSLTDVPPEYRLEPWLQEIQPLRMSPEHYQRFVEVVHDLLRQYEGISLHPIDRLPFGHLRIFAMMDEELLILKSRPRSLMLECSDPMLCQLFSTVLHD